MKIENTGTVYQQTPKQTKPTGTKPNEDTVDVNGGDTPLKPGDIMNPEVINAILSNNIKAGQKITISSGGKDLLQIKNDSPTTFDRLKQITKSGKELLSNTVQQDPSFAFKSAALLAKQQDLLGLSASLSGAVDKGFLPVVRIVGGLLDVMQLRKTLKTDPSKSADKFKVMSDKFIDIAHVGTDVLGVAGLVLEHFPGTAVLAKAFNLTALLSDIGAHGYHIMRYCEEKDIPVPAPSTTGTTSETPTTPVPAETQPKKNE